MRTMKEIAQDLGVNSSTVSRALDPRKQHLVSTATRGRVLAAAKASEYRPDPAAAGLRRRQSASVGVLVPDLDNRSIIKVVRAATAALEKHDYVTLVAESMDDPARVAKVFDQFRARRVDAVVVLAATVQDRPALTRLAKSVPVVLAVRRLDGVTLPSVVCDDRTGGRLVAEHLASLGHRRVAHIVGPESVMTFRERAQGFEETCRSHGVTVVAASTHHATIGEARRVAGDVLDGREVSAVFAHNDDMATGVLHTLRASGRSCPNEVSVVGYNDTDLARHVTPALTTVSWPAEQVGSTAAEFALKAISGGPSEARRVFVPVLVVRDSTAPQWR